MRDFSVDSRLMDEETHDFTKSWPHTGNTIEGEYTELDSSQEDLLISDIDKILLWETEVDMDAEWYLRTKKLKELLNYMLESVNQTSLVADKEEKRIDEIMTKLHEANWLLTYEEFKVLVTAVETSDKILEMDLSEHFKDILMIEHFKHYSTLYSKRDQEKASKKLGKINPKKSIHKIIDKIKNGAGLTEVECNLIMDFQDVSWALIIGEEEILSSIEVEALKALLDRLSIAEIINGRNTTNTDLVHRDPIEKWETIFTTWEFEVRKTNRTGFTVVKWEQEIELNIWNIKPYQILEIEDMPWIITIRNRHDLKYYVYCLEKHSLLGVDIFPKWLPKPPTTHQKKIHISIWSGRYLINPETGFAEGVWITSTLMLWASRFFKKLNRKRAK